MTTPHNELSTFRLYAVDAITIWNPMATTSTERARTSAWQSWELWCRLNGYEPFAVRTGLAEYLLWLVDPYGGALSAASAYQAYWAVRSSLSKAGWRDPASDPVVLAALAEIRLDDDLKKPRRSLRHFTREEIEHLTASIDDGSLRGIRDRAMIWLGYEGGLHPSRLVILRWRHIEFSEFDATVKILGRSPKFTETVAFYEDEEPLTAVKAWHEVRRRHDDEPVFSSIPWTDKRVSSIALTTGDVGRIVAKRALEAGLGKANGMALVRAR
jgi:integrase